MATIITTVKIWTNDETKENLSEKQIREMKADMVTEWLTNDDTKFTMFDEFCEDELYCSEIMFATEEERARIMTRFKKYLEECADDFIRDDYTESEVEVELEING